VSQYDEIVVIERKYHFAGGCARYMFELSIQEIHETLNTALEAVHDISTYVFGKFPGISSSQYKNQLFCYDLNNRQSIVSKYVCQGISRLLGPDLIRQWSQHFADNSGMHGWLLEEYFFAFTNIGNITLRANGGPINWPCSPGYFSFNANAPDKVDCPPNAWLRPDNWCQPTFDGVFYVSDTKIIRFIQITIGEEQRIDLPKVEDMIASFETREIFVEIAAVEFYFIVPTFKLGFFRTGTIENSAALTSRGIGSSFPLP
jgi:hypothetical protein